MGITRKVTKEAQASVSPVDEKQIDALIGKGGSVTQTNRKEIGEEKGSKSHAVLLKVPKYLMNNLEEELQFLPAYLKKQRTLYILQAIEEKINRDRKKRK